MIAKPYEQKTTHSEPRQQAGAEAERQMAHYLNRTFSQDPDAHVLNGLRLENRERPEQDGSPGKCQIDHLIVHRLGMFIIESKSVTEEVRVRPDGSGGDEWSRVYQGKEMGMASPVQQARRQSEFLRDFLQQHRQQLVGRVSIGLRTLVKVVKGTDQRGFKNAPIHLIVAFSDKGRIRRFDGWKEPQKPFPVFVTKADLVPDKIGQELERHRKGARLLGKPRGDYGLWSMEAQEAAGVAEFLAARHVDRSGAPPARLNRAAPNQYSPPSQGKPSGGGVTAEAVCKDCGARDLTARWGKFGYYWRCGACGKNTPMPTVCPACGAEGRRGDEIRVVRVRKAGPKYFRDCKACETSETIWTEG